MAVGDQPLTMQCRTCGGTFAFECFERNRKAKFGRDRRCRNCGNEKRKLYPKGDSAAAQRKYAKAQVANLGDNYIRQQLYCAGFLYGEIGQDLVTLKRNQLAMRRLARQLKKAVNESSEDPR